MVAHHVCACVCMRLSSSTALLTCGLVGGMEGIVQDCPFVVRVPQVPCSFLTRLCGKRFVVSVL
jgi:hypothetical protein